MTVETTAAPVLPTRRPAAKATRTRRWWRRRPFFRAQVLLHRWPALLLGLFLVLETTSGAVLLYQGELYRATSSELYRHTAGADPITPEDARGVVARAHPAYGASWVATDDGVYVVGNAEYKTLYFVDPGTGRINGHDNTDDGFLGWLVNLHDCAFTCEGYPWYSSWLAHPVWDGGPSVLTGLTWGGVLLGVLGCCLLLLVVTSLRIWWPGMKRLGNRFRVRRTKGRFARDYDLHNLIGAIALPFLLMWGVTGASFEFPAVEKAWLAITGGETDQPEPVYAVTPARVAPGTPALSYDDVVSVALAAVPGTVASVTFPTAEANYWEVDVRSGYGSYAHRAVYSGDTYVYVDPHVRSNVTVVDSARGEPLANRFYDKYLEPTHFGWQVNGWWRILWLLLGLSPLLLMITGISTWLHRRGVRKRRERART